MSSAPLPPSADDHPAGGEAASRRAPRAAGPARRAGRRGRARAVAATVLTGGTAGVLLLAHASPGGGTAEAAAACRTVAPKAAGAGSAKARVQRLVRGVGTNRAKAPTVRRPGGTPPARLIEDDRVLCGAGARAKTGGTVEVRYTIHLWRGKRGAVDSSWARTPRTTSFTLSKGQLIDGWVEGIRGMRVGSRRVLVIPPSKGYGKTGTPDGGIPGGATLISVIDLVGVS